MSAEKLQQKFREETGLDVKSGMLPYSTSYVEWLQFYVEAYHKAEMEKVKNQVKGLSDAIGNGLYELSAISYRLWKIQKLLK